MNLKWLLVLSVLGICCLPMKVVSNTNTRELSTINTRQLPENTSDIYKRKRLKKIRSILRKRANQTTDLLAGMSLGAGILTALFFILAQSIDVFGFISIITALVAVGLGIAGLFRIKNKPEKKGKGMAIAGIALGGGWLVILSVVLFFFTGG